MADDEEPPSKRLKLQDELTRTRKKAQRQGLLQSQDIQPIATPENEIAFADSDSSSSLAGGEENTQPIDQPNMPVSDIAANDSTSIESVSTQSVDSDLPTSSSDEEGTEFAEPDHNYFNIAHGFYGGVDSTFPPLTGGNETSSETEVSSSPDSSNPSSPDHSNPSSSDHSKSSSSSSDTSERSSIDREETVDENHGRPFTAAEGILGNNEFQNDFVIKEQDDPVCPCTDITVGEVLYMSLSLGFRHALSFNAVLDHIKMLNTIFKREVIPPTLYNLLKFAEPDRSEDLYHIYCPECGVYLMGIKEEELSKEVTCTCGWRIEKAKNADSFFMSLGMENQIRKLLETGDGIAESLHYRFTRQKIDEDALEDIYDGELYKKLTEPGKPLSIPENFSTSWNTDGIPFGDSSHQQIYPMYVMINELPPKQRVKNMLMVGIWVGKKKPCMEVMLQPFVNESNKLSSTGLDWEYAGEKIHSKVIPICCCVDSQERYKLLNHKAFSAEYGCTFCEHKGDHAKSLGIRYGMHETAPKLRTHESMTQHMLEAHETNRVIKGCKGLSPLINLEYFDLAQGPVLDFLHYSEGIVKQHLNILLAKLSEDDVLRISERMLKITTPTAITRTPRSLQYRGKFKASEWRSFLVLYGPVVMKGIVPDKYVAHFSLLSCAMHYLLQKSVRPTLLDYCDELIIMYCILYEQYFGLEKMTFNLHLLLHVIKAVLNHGPIWTHTCYPYEGKNKKVKEWAMSPFMVAKGVARKYSMVQNLPNLASRFGVCDNVLEYSADLCTKRLWIAVRNGNYSTLGKERECLLSNDEKAALQQLDREAHHESAVQYEQMMAGGVTFSTEDYGWSTRKKNCGVYLKDGSKCIIKKILNITVRESDKIILIVQKKIVSRSPLWRREQLSVTHIQEILQNGSLKAIYPSSIGGQCMFMEVDDKVYATCVPYGCVGD